MKTYMILQAERHVAQMQRAEAIHNGAMQLRAELDQGANNAQITGTIIDLFRLYSVETMPESGTMLHDGLYKLAKEIESKSEQLIMDLEQCYVDLDETEHKLREIRDLIQDVRFLRKGNGDGTGTDAS